MQKIDIKAFGLAGGIAFGVYVMMLGWIAMYGWGTTVVDMLSSLYIGYEPTFLGGIIGGVWAFLDFGIGAVIIAYLYNLFAQKSK